MIDINAVLQSLEKSESDLLKASHFNADASFNSAALVINAIRTAIKDGIESQKKINDAYDDYHGV